MKKPTCFPAVTTALTAIFLVISGCAVNPVTGKKGLSLMSEQQEIALGAENDPLIVQQYGLYEDAQIQQFLDLRGQEMARISHRSNLKFTFRILDSPVVNAFALPGGYVYFTRGILAHFNNEAEFAGVLGHEIGHITARHGAEQYTRQVLSQALLVGGLIVSKELRTFANEAQTAMGLLFLKYSRDNESQSDELGVEYSTKIGYDAREMADFFGTLKALGEQHGSDIPTFLSTHPDPANRETRVEQLANEWQAKDSRPTYKVNQAEYLRLIEGIIYGENPRQGFVDAGKFFHPDMRFEFPVPAGWKLANYPSQVRMAPDDGKAMVMMTLAEGTSLQETANRVTQELNLTVVSSRQVSVNGLPAVEVMSQQVNQDPNTGQTQTLAVQSHYILYNKLIYVFHGVTTGADFQTYDRWFDQVAGGFKPLTDPARLSVQPDRIKVVEAKADGTLDQALAAHGVPASKLAELAILNGMARTSRVSRGQLIKVLTK